MNPLPLGVAAGDRLDAAAPVFPPFVRPTPGLQTLEDVLRSPARTLRRSPSISPGERVNTAGIRRSPSCCFSQEPCVEKPGPHASNGGAESNDSGAIRRPETGPAAHMEVEQ